GNRPRGSPEDPREDQQGDRQGDREVAEGFVSSQARKGKRSTADDADTRGWATWPRSYLSTRIAEIRGFRSEFTTEDFHDSLRKSDHAQRGAATFSKSEYGLLHCPARQPVGTLHREPGAGAGDGLQVGGGRQFAARCQGRDRLFLEAVPRQGGDVGPHH